MICIFLSPKLIPHLLGLFRFPLRIESKGPDRSDFCRCEKSEIKVAKSDSWKKRMNFWLFKVIIEGHWNLYHRCFWHKSEPRFNLIPPQQFKARELCCNYSEPFRNGSHKLITFNHTHVIHVRNFEQIHFNLDSLIKRFPNAEHHQRSTQTARCQKIPKHGLLSSIFTPLPASLFLPFLSFSHRCPSAPTRTSRPCARSWRWCTRRPRMTPPWTPSHATAWWSSTRRCSACSL